MMIRVSHDGMVEAVLRLWDTGMDTARMSVVLKQKQDDVERWLHIGLDRRREQAKTTDV